MAASHIPELKRIDEHTASTFLPMIAQISIENEFVEYHLQMQKSTEAVKILQAGFHKLQNSLCCPHLEEGMCCRIISLSKNQFNTLWGEQSYENLVELKTLLSEAKDPKERKAAYEFLFLIESSSPVLFQQAFLLYGRFYPVFQKQFFCSLLETTLRFESPVLCAQLLQHVSTDVLNSALLPSQTGYSSLRTALDFQSPEISEHLISHCTDETLVKLFSCTTGYNIIDSASMLPSKNFIALMRKAPSVLLAKSLCLNLHFSDMNPFEAAAQYQTEAAFNVFLEKLNSPESLVALNQFFKKKSGVLVNVFRSIALYQPKQNILTFLSLLEPNIVCALTKEINKYISLPPFRFSLRAFQAKVAMDQNLEYKMDLNTFLKPLHDYDHKEARKIKEKKEEKSYSEKEKKAHQLFRSGTFFKAIRDDYPDLNADFLQLLFHPERRQSLRNPKNCDKQGFKLLIKPKEIETKNEAKTAVYTYSNGRSIIPCRTLDERKQHKTTKVPYVYSTKTPVTYISPNLFTGLYGHSANREIVGYAFTVNPDQIKLLALQDCGTFQRWWINKNLNTLFFQSNHLQNILCSRFADFVKKVDEQPYVLNEVLVKLNYQDCYAIVIGKDTLKARKLAIQRRVELNVQYGKDLPILFYNPDLRDSAIYSSAEQHVAQPVLFLMGLKKRIQAELIRINLTSFFSKPKTDLIHVTLEYKDYYMNIATAMTILGLISTFDKTPELAWEKIFSLLPEPELETSETNRLLV